MSDTAERVKKVIIEQLLCDDGRVTENAALIDDLGADSLDTIELVMALEEEFGIDITDDDASAIQTVGDVVRVIDARIPAWS